MTNWIERFAIPQRVFLAWQAPDHMGDRHRWAVGVIDAGDGPWRFSYFGPGPQFERLNSGKTFEQAQSLGYAGYPAFPLKQAEHREGVEETFMRRLPPATRSDLIEYKQQFRIPPDLKLPNFALLAATEAKLPSDGFSVVDPLDAAHPDCDLLLEIAGFRYYQEQAARAGLQVQVGDKAELIPEPDNKHDSGAVMIHVAGHKIGNINRLQAPTFLHWINTASVSAHVERLNGRADRPRVFLFIRVRRAA